VNGTTLKTIVRCACLMTIVHADLAAAHTQSQFLGAAAGATDFYQVICGDGGAGPTSRLLTRVKAGGGSSSPRVSVQVVKGGAAIHSTDPVSGDTGWGPELPLSGGPGIYKVTIDKDGSGVQSYTLDYHCQTPDGTHTNGDTDIDVLDSTQ